MKGNNPTLYGYVKDTNTWVDVFGLDSCGIDKDFDSGASFIITRNDFNRFVKGNDMVGRPDGQFVAPTNRINDLVAKANGDISVIEKGLGISPGEWQNKGGLYQIDIPDPKAYKLRPATADLSGANELFIPGGKTSGGIPEAVVNQIPVDQVKIVKIL